MPAATPVQHNVISRVAEFKLNDVLIFNITLQVPNGTDAEADALFQNLIDFLDGRPNIAILGEAQKLMRYTQAFTPTP